MLTVAAADGITHMVCTPHVFNRFSKFKEIEKIYEQYLLFKQHLKPYSTAVEIFFGAEIYFISGLRKTIRALKGILTINKSDYFLLEFPMDFVFPGSKEFIYDIMSDGLIPIICHPERNEMFQQNLTLLVELVEAGALTQINAGSISGQFGHLAQAIAHKLIKHNLAHVIASDCHDFHSRPPKLAAVVSEFPETKRDQILLMLNDIPQAILNNQAVPEISPIIPLSQKPAFFKQLFKRKIL